MTIHKANRGLRTNHLAVLGLPARIAALKADHNIGLHPEIDLDITPLPGYKDKLGTALEAKRKGDLSFMSDELRRQITEIKDLVKATHRVPKPGHDVVITTLGTGSALPSKYRNGLIPLVTVYMAHEGANGDLYSFSTLKSHSNPRMG